MYKRSTQGKETCYYAVRVGVEVKFHAFLTVTLYEVSYHLHVTAAMTWGIES
jgi:hypothetical protein